MLKGALLVTLTATLLAQAGAFHGSMGWLRGGLGCISESSAVSRLSAPFVRIPMARGAAVLGQTRIARGLALHMLSSDASGRVQEATSHEHFEELRKAPLAVVALLATSCRKCHAISGKFVSIANQYGGYKDDAVFAVVQIDKVREVAKTTGITKTPTYIVYVDGVKVDEYVGSEAVSVVTQKIKKMVQQWIEAPSTETLERERVADKDASDVVASYSPHKDDVGKEASSPSTGMPTDMCGEEGCEIVWD